MVFGKSVPDVSLNAVANLGYAECRFLSPFFQAIRFLPPLKLLACAKFEQASGVVYVRTTGRDQIGVPVLQFVRWVMVRKRDKSAPAPGEHVPELKKAVEPAALGSALPPIDIGAYNTALSGATGAGAVMRLAKKSTTWTA